MEELIEEEKAPVQERLKRLPESTSSIEEVITTEEFVEEKPTKGVTTTVQEESIVEVEKPTLVKAPQVTTKLEDIISKVLTTTIEEELNFAQKQSAPIETLTIEETVEKEEEVRTASRSKEAVIQQDVSFVTENTAQPSNVKEVMTIEELIEEKEAPVEERLKRLTENTLGIEEVVTTETLVEQKPTKEVTTSVEEESIVEEEKLPIFKAPQETRKPEDTTSEVSNRMIKNELALVKTPSVQPMVENEELTTVTTTTEKVVQEYVHSVTENAPHAVETVPIVEEGRTITEIVPERKGQQPTIEEVIEEEKAPVEVQPKRLAERTLNIEEIVTTEELVEQKPSKAVTTSVEEESIVQEQKPTRVKPTQETAEVEVITSEDLTTTIEEEFVIVEKQSPPIETMTVEETLEKEEEVRTLSTSIEEVIQQDVSFVTENAPQPIETIPIVEAAGTTSERVPDWKLEETTATVQEVMTIEESIEEEKPNIVEALQEMRKLEHITSEVSNRTVKEELAPLETLNVQPIVEKEELRTVTTTTEKVVLEDVHSVAENAPQTSETISIAEESRTMTERVPERKWEEITAAIEEAATIEEVIEEEKATVEEQAKRRAESSSIIEEIIGAEDFLQEKRAKRVTTTVQEESLSEEEKPSLVKPTQETTQVEDITSKALTTAIEEEFIIVEKESASIEAPSVEEISENEEDITLVTKTVKKVIQADVPSVAEKPQQTSETIQIVEEATVIEGVVEQKPKETTLAIEEITTSEAVIQKDSWPGEEQPNRMVVSTSNIEEVTITEEEVEQKPTQPITISNQQETIVKEERRTIAHSTQELSQVNETFPEGSTGMAQEFTTVQERLPTSETTAVKQLVTKEEVIATEASLTVMETDNFTEEIIQEDVSPKIDESRKYAETVPIVEAVSIVEEAIKEQPTETTIVEEIIHKRTAIKPLEDVTAIVQEETFIEEQKPTTYEATEEIISQATSSIEEVESSIVEQQLTSTTKSIIEQIVTEEEQSLVNTEAYMFEQEKVSVLNAAAKKILQEQKCFQIDFFMSTPRRDEAFALLPFTRAFWSLFFSCMMLKIPLVCTKTYHFSHQDQLKYQYKESTKIAI